jgi:SAM-dependent methyltransferase
MSETISRQRLWDLELEQLYKERETSDPDPEMWRWSPLELWEFDRMLTVARQLLPGLREVTFCEAGCGIGTKLYLAEHYHDLRATGFEISDDYLEKARALGVDARHMDLRTDSPNWGAFDIVYTARPFKVDDVESAWEQSVCEAMRPGAVIMMAYTSYKPYSWQCYYRAPFRGVWRKPKASPGVYDQMIRRQYPNDPLVPEPVGYPG